MLVSLLTGPAGKRRADVLLAGSAGKRRADVLVSLLTGDVGEQYVELRIPGGSENIDTGAWASSVSWALLPGVIKCFARHRWCNSSETLHGWTLLANVHDVLRTRGSCG